MLTTQSVTKSSTGAVALRALTHVNLRETAGATARFTLRYTNGSGDVIMSRTMAATESDDVDFSEPVFEKTVGAGFHFTLDSGAASVVCSGQ